MAGRGFLPFLSDATGHAASACPGFCPGYVIPP
jgi:hypothetical protein